MHNFSLGLPIQEIMNNTIIKIRASCKMQLIKQLIYKMEKYEIH